MKKTSWYEDFREADKRLSRAMKLLVGRESCCDCFVWSNCPSTKWTKNPKCFSFQMAGIENDDLWNKDGSLKK